MAVIMSRSVHMIRPDFRRSIYGHAHSKLNTASHSECLEHLKDLAEKMKPIPEQKGAEACDTKPQDCPDSLESSKSQLLEWSKELNKITKLPESEESWKKNEELLGWAEELRSISELLHLTKEDLNTFSNNGEKSPKLECVQPFLDFVVFSLKSNKSKDDLSKVWLPAEQKKWRNGMPVAIPFTVWQWIVSASVAVHLNPNTSHHLLAVSPNRLQVSISSGSCSSVMDHPDRFDKHYCVLGDEVFTAGRHYWTVRVSPEGSWRMGVTSASARRKGDLNMSPVSGYWTLQKSPIGLLANEHHATKLQVDDMPSLVGIYLDMEERQVSFYDAERAAHIYTFMFYQLEKELKPVFGVLDRYTELTMGDQ